MPATVTTKESMTGVPQADLEREIELRVKAGAIRAWIEVDNGETILYTEWNVIGEQ